MRYFILISILLLMVSCSTDPTRDVVSAKVAGEQLIIENGTGEDIYFFAVEEGVQTFVIWVPTITPKNRVPAESRRSVALGSNYVVAVDEELTLIFYWWNAVRVDGDLQPGDVQSMRVSLRSTP